MRSQLYGRTCTVHVCAHVFALLIGQISGETLKWERVLIRTGSGVSSTSTIFGFLEEVEGKKSLGEIDLSEVPPSILVVRQIALLKAFENPQTWQT